MALQPNAGRIHGGVLPPRIDNPNTAALVGAAGATVTFLRQRFRLMASDDFLEKRLDPEFLAGFLVELTMEMIAMMPWFNQPVDKTALGTTRVSMLLFNAVLNLFIGNLLGRLSAQAEFEENMRSLEKTARHIVTLRDSDIFSPGMGEGRSN